MITDIPKSSDFRNHGTDYLNLGWGTVTEILLDMLDADDWSNGLDKEMTDEFWRASERELATALSLAGAKHVYLTESETDAIALLHTGIEQEEQSSAIVAVSGASNFQSDWAHLFKDRKVTLCFDSDEAGQEGANKTGLFLKPFVSELFIYEGDYPIRTGRRLSLSSIHKTNISSFAFNKVAITIHPHSHIQYTICG